MGLTTTSSPHFAQSNGEAERMIRTVKDLFRKADDPHLALLSYRDTPGVNGFSPAQLLMGRQLKTRVPKRDEQLRPNWPVKDKVASNDLVYKRQQAADYNRRHAARDLPSLRTGEQVWVRPDQVRATVLSPAQRPRSYIVEAERGGVLQRNRHHLVPFGGEAQPQDQPESAQHVLVPEQSRPASPTGPPPATEPVSVPTDGDGVVRTRSGRRVVRPTRLNL